MEWNWKKENAIIVGSVAPNLPLVAFCTTTFEEDTRKMFCTPIFLKLYDFLQIVLNY